MNYVIGVDLGTSATKTILVNEKGRTVCSAEYSYTMDTPQNGWAEQDPRIWRKAVLETLKEVMQRSGVNRDSVLGLGLSGQMHGSVVLDENDEPVRKAILWCDQRSVRQTQEMLRLISFEQWLEITANPPLAAWTAEKLLWIRENEPQNYSRIRHVLLPKDYIRLVLTGEYATDVSDATGMQLLDVKNRRWSDEVLRVLQIDRSLLGTLYESAEATGTVRRSIAEECGLSDKTIVAAGGSDNACAALGTGVVNEGQAFVTLGTSSVVYTHFQEYIQIPGGGLHVCCCAVPGCWHSMGGPMSAGMSIEWFKNNFCQDLMQKAKERGESFYEQLTEMVEHVPIGSDRLIYLPFLMGERTPHMDPLYRGAFLGLSEVHTQAHMLRSIMEGISFSLADCNDLLKKQNIKVTSLRVTGGGSRSIAYRKMLAALFRCDVHEVEGREGAAYGAAILGGVASKLFSSVQEACMAFVREKNTVTYSKKEADIYDRFHQVYDHMYDALKDSFHELAQL